MTGLDTNVLVRYLAQDDPKQSPAASRFIEEQCSAEAPGFINHLVLCELVWVLKSCYAVGREQTLQVIEQILKTVQLRIQEPQLVWAALRQARDGKADFPDCLIGRINTSQGCQHTVTFDRVAADIENMILIY
jgi:predicted nucleic-acid-binding protein